MTQANNTAKGSSNIDSTGQLSLTTGVTGILPVANGGTGSSSGPAAGGSTTQVQYNSSGAFAGSANMTFSGTALTLANDASISGLTVGKGLGSIASNTAIGNTALGTNTSGAHNVAVGYNASPQSNTGSYNVAVGENTLFSNITGSYNTALGIYALQSNTASNNTAVGYQAGYSNTTGTSFTAMGYKAGYSQTTVNGGTYFGTQAGQITTGEYNTMVGAFSGYFLTTGTGNTFVGTAGAGSGSGCGGVMTTGSKNTILGAYTGNNSGLDIRTASNYIVLSDGDGNPRAYWDSTGKLVSTGSSTSTCFTFTNSSATTPSGAAFTFSAAAPNNGTQTFFTTSDTGGYRGGWLSNGGVQNYQANNSNLSDQREKKNIELAPNYLDKLCQIPVKTFLFNDQTDEDLNLGVIAQDIQAICPELVTESNWAGKDSPEKLRLSIYQTDLQYAMLKAIQELNAKVTALEAQLGK